MTAPRTGLLVVGPMIVLVPLIAIQGPLNTAPVDYLNAVFITVYWAWLLARRARLRLPFLLPFWLIVLGSLTGLWEIPYLYYRLVACLTMARGLYLYVWCVTVADLLRRTCRPADVVALWATVAAAIGLASFADLHAGVAGGLLLESSERARGTFLNPNMFGSYLVVSFFLTWAAAESGRRWLWLALPALIAAVRATGSNGALLSLLSGVAVASALRPNRNLWRWVGGGLIAAGILVAVVVPNRQAIADAAADVFSRDRGEVGGAVMKGYDERMALWSEAWETIRRFPAGVGPGNFDYLSGDVSGDYNSAHNDYLGMLVERGPLGLIGWCVLLASAGRLVVRLRRAGPRAELAWVPMAGLVAALAAHAFVIELFHFRHVWLAFAVLAAATTRTSGASTPAALGFGVPRSAVPEAA